MGEDGVVDLAALGPQLSDGEAEVFRDAPTRVVTRLRWLQRSVAHLHTGLADRADDTGQYLLRSARVRREVAVDGCGMNNG